MNVINPNRFLIMHKIKGFREKQTYMSVIVAIFFIFMFVEQLLLVDVFSQLYYLTYAKKELWRTSIINR